MTLHRCLLRSRTATVAGLSGNANPLICASKFARTLDWNGTACTPAATGSAKGTAAPSSPHGVVVSLSIGRTHLNVTLATHPARREPIRTLPSIALSGPSNGNELHPLSRGRLRERAVAALTQTLADNHVDMPSALLVSWPVQRDNGRCGAACGRVWHVLDGLWQPQQHEASTLLPFDTSWRTIPTCLYDVHHTLPDEDEWGRSAAHATIPPSSLTQHVASLDQYWGTEATEGAPVVPLATRQWMDYCRMHWPQFPVVVPDRPHVEPYRDQDWLWPMRHRLDAAVPTHSASSARHEDATSRRRHRATLLSERRRDEVLAAWWQRRDAIPETLTVQNSRPAHATLAAPPVLRPCRSLAATLPG